jgi:predicted dehydrogenase
VAAAAGAPAVLGAKAANETIGVGQIGIGVRGGTLIRQVAGTKQRPGVEGVKVVAVCDVYKPHLQKGVDRSMNPSVRTYGDYQDLLADPAVDAVVIAVPDHWHAQMLIDASAAGKDVYIEKGWTRTVDEAKAMRAAVKKSKIVMQLGHQGRQSAAVIQARELIRGGVIGPVTLVRTGRLMNRERDHAIYRWYGGYNEYDRPDPKQVIDDLNWTRWLGSAPQREFDMGRFWHWRCYWDYGTGVAGDLLSHELDFVQAVLRHGIPKSCVASGVNAMLKDGREIPDTMSVVYEFGEGNGQPEHLVTFDTTFHTALPPQPPEFRGKDAYLICNGIAQDVNTFEIFAEPITDKYGGDVKRGQPFRRFDPAKTPAQPSHMQDFFDCVRSRQKTKCDEDEAFIEAVTFIMSIEALTKERKVRWDRAKEEIV